MRKMFFAFLWGCLLLCKVNVATAADYNAALVADMDTGTVLFKDRADDLNYPASLTKIMTLYLTFDALEHERLHLDDYLIVSKTAAAASPVKLGLAAGTKISVDDAIKAVAVHSANDVARVLAENLQGGKEGNFAALMTNVAREIGLTKTNFENASGLPDEDHLSSARDIALLSMAVYKHFPQYWHYFGLKSFTFDGKTYANGNRLLGTYAGTDGMKTGYTNSAKYCLVATAKRGDRHIMSVVLGAPNKDVRASVSMKLLDRGFAALGENGTGSFEYDADTPTVAKPAPVKTTNAKPFIQTAKNRGATNTASSGNAGIQFGAFGSKSAAVTQQNKVQNTLGVDTYLEQYSGMWRVRAGGLSNTSAQKLKNQADARGIDSYVFH